LPFFSLDLFGYIFLAVWLAFETAWDIWKSVVLPLVLVVPPLIIGGAVQLLMGHGWLTAGACVGILLHMSSRLWVRILGTAILILAALFYGLTWLAIGFGLYWLLWEGNIMGGADALAAYAVFLFFPTRDAFWLVLAGIFLWALAYMVFSYRAQLLDRIQQMFLRLFMKSLPTEQELISQGKPSLGGVWLGMLLLSAWHFLGSG
jgi:hypothetical protein